MEEIKDRKVNILLIVIASLVVGAIIGVISCDCDTPETCIEKGGTPLYNYYNVTCNCTLDDFTYTMTGTTEVTKQVLMCGDNLSYPAICDEPTYVACEK